MTPDSTNPGSITWDCNGNAALPNKYLPASCRIYHIPQENALTRVFTELPTPQSLSVGSSLFCFDCRPLDVEPEMHDVRFLDNVFLAFQP